MRYEITRNQLHQLNAYTNFLYEGHIEANDSPLFIDFNRCILEQEGVELPFSDLTEDELKACLFPGPKSPMGELNGFPGWYHLGGGVFGGEGAYKNFMEQLKIILNDTEFSRPAIK